MTARPLSVRLLTVYAVVASVSIVAMSIYLVESSVFSEEGLVALTWACVGTVVVLHLFAALLYLIYAYPKPVLDTHYRYAYGGLLVFILVLGGAVWLGIDYVRDTAWPSLAYIGIEIVHCLILFWVEKEVDFDYKVMEELYEQ